MIRSLRAQMLWMNMVAYFRVKKQDKKIKLYCYILTGVIYCLVSEINN